MAQLRFTIATVETAAEVQAYVATLARASHPELSEAEQAHVAAGMATRMQEWAKVVPTTRRAAFQGNVCLGTYQLEERQLLLGPTQIRTGCIGNVATHPAYQRQGVATALMHDAVAYARAQHLPLLLLVGIPNFYRRFGFTNVMDYPIQSIALSDLAAQPPSPYTVRPATERDSAALLALYQREHQRFIRSAAVQAHQLRARLPHHPAFLAVDTHDAPHGYLLLPDRYESGRAVEGAATDWAAALALLHQHARLLNALPEPPRELRWPHRFDTALAYETADHVPVTWQIICVPDGEWMAHIVDLPRFVHGLVPLWQQRRHRQPSGWVGRVTQVIGEYAFTLDATDDGVRLLPEVQRQAPTMRFSVAVFTKLVFGWRSLDWARRQAETLIPDHVAAVADVLYTMDRIWFPPSDEF